jgi:Arc/MetJ-type ribon-helix-helix transcriptional regulator
VPVEITLTKPIEAFIESQLAKGYSDVNEVARQAFIRWMAEEDFEAAPPGAHEKIEAALSGAFRPYDPRAYDHSRSLRDENPG